MFHLFIQACLFASIIPLFLAVNTRIACKVSPITLMREYFNIQEDYESFCQRLGDVFDQECYCLYKNRLMPSINVMESYFRRNQKNSNHQLTFKDYERDVIFNYAFNIAPVMEKRLLNMFV